jgi:hypothetical protein
MAKPTSAPTRFAPCATSPIARSCADAWSLSLSLSNRHQIRTGACGQTRSLESGEVRPTLRRTAIGSTLSIQHSAFSIQHSPFTIHHILQEAITLLIFVPFAMLYMRTPFKLDYLWAGLCLLGAVYFIFRS